jgi:hypothetical protein
MGSLSQATMPPSVFWMAQARVCFRRQTSRRHLTLCMSIISRCSPRPSSRSEVPCEFA